MVRSLLALKEFSGHPDFLRLMGARFLGSSANHMLMVAMGWQMYNLTASAWDLGLIGLYQFAPVLLLTLVAGHAADRYPRTRIIACCMALQAAVATVLLAGSASQTLSREMLLVTAVILGTARAFQHPAQGSLVGALLPPSLLPRGAAVHGATIQSSVIGGPALAGLLFLDTGVTVYVTGLLLLSASLVLALRIRPVPTASPGQPLSIQSLLVGVRFVAGNPILLGAVSLDLMAVLLGGATALLPVYAKDILQVGSEGLGALRAAPALGAVACSVALSRHPLRRRVGRWMFAGVAIYGLSTLVFGLSTHFWLSLLALAVSGAADMVSVVIRHTLMQLDTPDAIRGRVGSVNTIFIGASNQLGEFESGAVAAWIGPVGSVVSGALGTLVVVGLWMRLFPALLRRDTFH